ncbi:hypothetical protein JRC04_05265 [Mycolicibacterium sp. S2-37]|uniref:hypothetical protein n=1 Tax=Mycolicibacterium sp. S2-37 TaxID=2810297 RepID=UPI001A9426F1|nr:hypothetical protein [Mycolicibacterium sp. S2-37]MBO0676864.1 hypothetical protein [Mycolicibacterium sp. S2-37]
MKNKIIIAIAALAAIGAVGCTAQPQPYYDGEGLYCEFDEMEPGDRGYIDQNGMFCERDDDGE